MTGKQTVGLNSKAATIYAGQGRSELCGQQNSKNSQIQPKQPKNQNDNINNSHMSIWPVGQLAVPSLEIQASGMWGICTCAHVQIALPICSSVCV